MTDLISRQAAIDAVHEEFDGCLVWDESGETTANEFERILDYLPSADAVEVVRCKDCRYWTKDEQYATIGFCRIWRREIKSKEYCSEGRRKE